MKLDARAMALARTDRAESPRLDRCDQLAAHGRRALEAAHVCVQQGERLEAQVASESCAPVTSDSNGVQEGLDQEAPTQLPNSSEWVGQIAWCRACSPVLPARKASRAACLTPRLLEAGLGEPLHHLCIWCRRAAAAARCGRSVSSQDHQLSLN
jgi:hypothetical protein